MRVWASSVTIVFLHWWSPLVQSWQNQTKGFRIFQSNTIICFVLLFVFLSHANIQVCKTLFFGGAGHNCNAPKSSLIPNTFGLWRINKVLYENCGYHTFPSSGFYFLPFSCNNIPFLEETLLDLGSAPGISVGIFGFVWDSRQTL